MRAKLSVFVLFLGVFLLFARPSYAQDPGQVAVGGEELFTIKVAAGGKSPKERADAVSDRLPPILGSASIEPSDIKVVKATHNRARIYVKKRFLVLVWPEDGKPNGKTAYQQAQTWAAQARKVLPHVNAKPNPNTEKGQ